VKSNPLQFALRETQAAGRSRYTWIALGLVIALLTVSGPYDTFESLGLGPRFAYWASMVLACYFVGRVATRFFLESLRDAIPQRWPRAVISAVVAALPVTAIVIMVNGLAHDRLAPSDALTLWVDTTLVTLVVVIAFVSMDDFVSLRRPSSVAPPAAAPPGPPPIVERVPLPQRGKLLALSVEDHYVDIVTDRGKTLVLMRLADAMRETGAIPGLQIHRSHWVARDAVARTHRADGKVLLELSNGMRLPVSRGFLPQVREAGLG